jgi:HAE1 family hydrophobic/amphiphilic exporter-1
MGGMLMGTLFGVLIIPGLYYVFAKMADGRSLIKGESSEPVSEEFMRMSEGESKTRETLRQLKKIIKKLTKRDSND